MKRELKFETSLTEDNCPGISDMDDLEIAECAIELVKIEKELALRSKNGRWLAHVYDKKGGAVLVNVIFHYDETTN